MDEACRFAAIQVSIPSVEWLTNNGEDTEEEGWKMVQEDVAAHLRHFGSPGRVGARLEWEDWERES